MSFKEIGKIRKLKVYECGEKYGEVVYPEGFFDTIRGLDLEEQLDHFRIAGSSRYCNTGWSERETKYLYSLEESGDVRGLIVKNGYIAGVIVNDFCGNDVPLRPEHGTCTYSASDNNGAGYKERTDYAYLLCIKPNET